MTNCSVDARVIECKVGGIVCDDLTVNDSMTRRVIDDEFCSVEGYWVSAEVFDYECFSAVGYGAGIVFEGNLCYWCFALW